MTDSSLGYQIFRWVKYLIYALLSLNIWLFLAEENDSARFAIASGEDVVMGVQLFSATLDTLAWVILLLLFELETAVIPNDRLKGPLRFGIHGVRMLCTTAIVMAFLGYFGEWRTLLPSELLAGEARVDGNEPLEAALPQLPRDLGPFRPLHAGQVQILVENHDVRRRPAELTKGARDERVLLLDGRS